MSNQPELVYPELSFKIVGILFGVYNELGPGHKEKYYENAVDVALEPIHYLTAKYEEN